MPMVEIDGIATHYEVIGDGPPLLMFSPGGFDATMEKWRSLSVYARIKLLGHLPAKYRCIVFDRRETGQSGGRVECVTWAHFVAQGRGLLDHLGIECAHLMGGCMGCPPVAAFAVAMPDRVLSMIHYWPVGGAKYRIKGTERFATHLEFVDEQGMQGVVDLLRSHDRNFSQDPRGGPWGAPIRNDPDFATAYAALDVAQYKQTVTDMVGGLFDRDTAPGAEPEDLLKLDIPALIIPGKDESHATSAARYLEECIPGAQYWDVAPDEQTEETAPARILEFLDSV
jgi:pimeloyl-ACP methyl ester carboxylesterase